MFKEIGHVALRVKDYEAMQKFLASYNIRKCFNLLNAEGKERIGYYGLPDGHFIEMFPVVPPRHHGFTGDNVIGNRSFQYAQLSRGEDLHAVMDPENNEWVVSDHVDGVEGAVFNCTKYDEMVKFYRDIVRMTVTESNDHRTVFTFPSGQYLELRNAPYFTDNNTMNRAIHHLAFLCDDIIEEAENLEQYGIKLSHGSNKNNPVYEVPFREVCKLNSDKSYAFYFNDPEGNDVEAMQYSEESLQITWNKRG